MFYWKFGQRVSCEYTANANELGTRALPVSCRFRILKNYNVGIDRNGGEFIGNTFTHSHTELYILIQMKRISRI